VLRNDLTPLLDSVNEPADLRKLPETICANSPTSCAASWSMRCR